MAESQNEEQSDYEADGVQPQTLVFVNVQGAKRSLKEISLLAVHTDEVKSEAKPRVIDKLRLGFESRLFDKNAADQIAGFINLQASPVCLLVRDDNTKQLKALKESLEICNVNLADDVCFAYLKMTDDGDERSPYAAGDFDNGSGLRWVKQHEIEFFKELKPEKFGIFATNQESEESIATSSECGSSHVTLNETLVFLDLEATGLDTRKITEINMMAFSKQRLLHSGRGAVPTECDMLNLVVDPLIQINAHASSITKLTRSIITRSAKKSFDEDVAAAVCQFLKRYPDPVCLVSHGGRDSDFEVLRTHVERFPSLTTGIGYLKCYDTYLGFRRLRRMPCRLSLAALYAHCFYGSNPEGSHTAEADVVSLIKVVTCFPGVLDSAQKTKFFYNLNNLESKLLTWSF